MGILNRIIGNADKVSNEELQSKYQRLLIPEEEIELGFKLLRDTYIFTDKRLILVDKQGVTGSKREYLSLPYKSISRVSLETAGTFDLDAELKIFISSDKTPTVSKKFNKNIDIYEVQKFLMSKIL